MKSITVSHDPLKYELLIINKRIIDRLLKVRLTSYHWAGERIEHQLMKVKNN